MRSPEDIPQELFIRTRENPYFNGLLRGSDASRNQIPPFDFQANDGRRNISHPTSDIGDAISKKFISDTSEKSMDSPPEDSVSATFGMLSKIVKTGSFAFPSFQSNLDDTYDSGKESSLMNSEATEEIYVLPSTRRPIVAKSYSVNKREPKLSRILLPQSAASFYNGFSQVEIVESCDSIEKINTYLKARKDDVNAGVPGRFLHAVIGQDVFDVGSIASTIAYAFYLTEALQNDQFCTVPVINVKRADLSSHAEIKWLLDSCQIDESSLIFIDEIDLSYYDLFGSLKLVLLNGHKLPAKLEALKEAVTDIFNCRKVLQGESVYPGVQTVIVGQESSCTLITEKFALTSPQFLAVKGFSRLLLAGILLDTANLTSPHCTTKDKYMATLLINGAGRFGINGLYQILRYKMHNISELKVMDILRKDFKKWKRVGKPDGSGSTFTISYIGMSSVGMSIEQLLAHEDTSSEEIKYFQQLEKLQLLAIVSGYYDPQKNFKKEMLVTAESMELMKNLLFFFDSKASQLTFKVLHQTGLKDEMRAFEIDKVTSRKTVERLLEEFGGTLKG